MLSRSISISRRSVMSLCLCKCISAFAWVMCDSGRLNELFFLLLLLVEHIVDCLQDKQWPEHRKYMHWNLLIPPITVLDICIWNDIYYFIIQFTPQLIDIRYAGIDEGNWLFLDVVEGRLRSCSFTLFGDWIFFRAPCRGSLNDTSSEYLRLYNSQERICFFDVYLPLMNGDCDYSSHASAAALPWP